ncbi:hypothetical protein AX16_003285 [Volvariella volvacea WC 439]|nr:hypothetical protein AX16_003285 [Volvariella volvacea WC 439]
MAHQSPMISIPKKSTDEVDWTTPIRTLIAQSYGENPENYANECNQLTRCRQDAVRGAGSEVTARDLLYKYFGQLELLELRFSEIRVNFPWRDAFTNKLTTQSSIAFEKASILFQIAATHSAIASSQSRSDPEGLKRSFHYFRTCAGMLTYINENFLHAPSTDLSREVIKFLVGLILAQATEVFLEKTVDEKKGNALIAKVGTQAAAMYAALNDEVKEFMGKGIFDRNWVLLIQIKAKYFASLSQYYRGLADNAAGKHGDALVRFGLAESQAKEANKLAVTFSVGFVSTLSPQLPVDAGSSIQERTKAHHVLCLDKKNEAQRENDLIYNAILPPAEALAAIDKANVATPISIHDVYSNPEVQKTIGQDFFLRLIPLSVHESASVYSEEKAKLVRAEVEQAEGAEGEMRSALESLGVREGLARFRAMAEGEVSGGEELPIDVRRWKEDITLVEDREGVEGMLKELKRLKDGVQQELDGVSRELEIESKDCEMMRVKYDHLWTQAPSATPSKALRQDLKSHYGALEAAAASDGQVLALWNVVKGDIQILLSPQVEDVFRASADHGAGSGQHLLDLDVSSEADDAKERAKIRGLVQEIDERLSRLSKISRERGEVLKDLKEKIQSDDVSHLLLLNRRNSAVEPTLFATELEKFRPYQQRLEATVHHQRAALQEVAQLWKNLRDLAGRGPGARRWEDRERRKKDAVKRFSKARDGYMEVRDGIAKGLQFYTELGDLTKSLQRNAKQFVTSRAAERESLAAKLETEKRLSVSAQKASSPPPLLAPKPPLPPPPPAPSTSPRPASGTQQSLEHAFASMGLGNSNNTPQPSGYNLPPPPPQPQQRSSDYMRYGNQYSSTPPPPPSAPTHPPSAPPAPAGHPGYGPPPAPRHPTLPDPPARMNSLSQPYSSSPARDPYASLGMWNLETLSAPPANQGGAHPSAPPLPPPPPPPSQSSFYSSPPPPPQQNYQQNYYQPQAPPPPPPPPGGHNYASYGNPQQQQQQPQYGNYSASPSHAQHYRQNSYSTPPGPPPPPPSSQGYSGYGQNWGV